MIHHQSLVWISFNRKQQVGLLNHQMWLLCCYMLRTAWPDAEALSATASKEVATSREHHWRWLESASHLDVIRWYAFVVLEPQNQLFPVKSRLCVLTEISGSTDKPTPSLQVTFKILCQSKLVWSTGRSSLQELLFGCTDSIISIKLYFTVSAAFVSVKFRWSHDHCESKLTG